MSFDKRQFWQSADQLRGPEKWQIGQAYAEVSAAGNRLATSGLKKALIETHGFDFVPESLRSNTFTEAAARVLSAHFGMNNYYNEQAPMATLANLGTSIPKPAFAKCMEATLAVWLGNAWGHSWEAVKYADKVVNAIRKEQWEYYLNECLPRDRTVLDKIESNGLPVGKWRGLAKKYDFGSSTLKDKEIKYLVSASLDTQSSDQAVAAKARTIREKMAS